ncbi:MAG: hypothetical protein Q7R33_04695 [Nitrosarchaeum sp.]|nr:hypothetical protein [Nitrosarchaeum sp.]
MKKATNYLHNLTLDDAGDVARYLLKKQCPKNIKKGDIVVYYPKINCNSNCHNCIYLEITYPPCGTIGEVIGPYSINNPKNKIHVKIHKQNSPPFIAIGKNFEIIDHLEDQNNLLLKQSPQKIQKILGIPPKLLKPSKYSIILENLCKIHERKLPHSTCSKCNSKKIIVETTLFSGPYSGTVRCKSCGHQESMWTYLGKKLVTVQPLPLGAIPTFTLGCNPIIDLNQ